MVHVDALDETRRANVNLGNALIGRRDDGGDAKAVAHVALTRDRRAHADGLHAVERELDRYRAGGRRAWQRHATVRWDRHRHGRRRVGRRDRLLRYWLERHVADRAFSWLIGDDLRVHRAVILGRHRRRGAGVTVGARVGPPAPQHDHRRDREERPTYDRHRLDPPRRGLVTVGHRLGLRRRGLAGVLFFRGHDRLQGHRPAKPQGIPLAPRHRRPRRARQGRDRAPPVP